MTAKTLKPKQTAKAYAQWNQEASAIHREFTQRVEAINRRYKPLLKRLGELAYQRALTEYPEVADQLGNMELVPAEAGATLLLSNRAGTVLLSYTLTSEDILNACTPQKNAASKRR